ncbi:unnamed protein product [Soboliphyme baturini]|uniref:Intramembrane protease 2 n=1 Tax=Soboliphyme baturini TaxID=241478 RepID=A0A183IC84_9BILA|nr:unnamed protein product [Soboliphyme baturini]
MLAYSAIYFMAVISIVFGSYRSLRFVEKHVKENKKIENSIRLKDAKWFPISASVVLFAFYVAFRYALVVEKTVDTLLLVNRYLDGNRWLNATAVRDFLMALKAERTNNGFKLKEYLMIVLPVFFCFQGVLMLSALIKPLVSRLLNKLPQSLVERVKLVYFSLKFSRSNTDEFTRKKDLVDWSFDSHDLYSAALCSVVAIAHITKSHWITNDIFAFAFSLYSIGALHLSSFKGGIMLLAGLFVYDIFWVFATDVMATVATNINAPILLMFPQDLLEKGLGGTKFAMLGLGDVVIPGIFLALLLRYGVSVKNRLYFYIPLIAYGAGLILTIAVMHYFKAGQPALLYLVPSCIGAPLLLAFINGDSTTLMNFSEDHLVLEEDEEEAEIAEVKDTDKTAESKEETKKEK